jgi:hypothetical protein
VNQLALPALDGRTPLGFLTALGVLRLLSVHAGEPTTRLAWSTQDCTALLTTTHPSVDDVAATLHQIIDTIPPHGVLPGAPVDLPPPAAGSTTDPMRQSRAAHRDLAARFHATGGTEAETWLASLVTDLCLDTNARVEISLFAAPSGQQKMRTMLEKPLQMLRDDPRLLHQALTGWRRYPGVTGEYLDHQVLYDAADSPDGKSQERGVPGATWLALMSYPLMHTTAHHNQPVTTCWQRYGPRPSDRRMVYPLWSAPLDLPAVAALLQHPVLSHAIEGNLPAAARELTIFRIARAERRRIPGRTFAGVLVPLP